jgi:BirA family transcriptional regulator, biotin operon repressor / biotin---[acetyl-CoA-carboxylase] ligase
MPSNKNINYIHFDKIDSTHMWAKRNAHSFDSHRIYCITAAEQTAGIGRLHKPWISPKGKNIYATLYFTLPKESRFIANLGQLLSISCARVLKAKGFQPEIKWPNDLLLCKQKVAGVLCEIIPFKSALGVILSIGINVNMSEELLKTIDQPATSLVQVSGRTWDLSELLHSLLHQFLKDLPVLEKKGFAAFFKEYNDLLAFKGEKISCAEPAVTGICHSIDSEGRLLLLLPSGELMPITSCS